MSKAILCLLLALAVGCETNGDRSFRFQRCLEAARGNAEIARICQERFPAPSEAK